KPAAPASSSPDVPPITELTVGEYLGAVRSETDLAHKTIADYAGCLRFVVSEVLAMGKGKKRRQYDHCKGGHKAWLAEIDAVKLGSIHARENPPLEKGLC